MKSASFQTENIKVIVLILTTALHDYDFGLLVQTSWLHGTLIQTDPQFPVTLVEIDLRQRVYWRILNRK